MLRGFLFMSWFGLAKSKLRLKFPLIGQSRPWASGQHRAAMRQLPAAQPLMAVNGRFRHLRRTVPDPFRPVSFLQSCRSAKPCLGNLECSEAATGELTQSAISGH